MASETVIDARGLLCPQPVIRLQDYFKGIKAGTTAEVIATDPGVLEDIPLWCRVNGHTHLCSSENNHEYRVKVRSGT